MQIPILLRTAAIEQLKSIRKRINIEGSLIESPNKESTKKIPSSDETKFDSVIKTALKRGKLNK